jgi:hypothetical protein
VQKLHDNLDRAKVEAKHALEGKKRMLQQALDRRFEEAMDAIEDEVQAKKLPLDQAAGDIKRSSAVLDAALETLESKLREPQQDFIQRFVPMIEVCSESLLQKLSSMHSNLMVRCQAGARHAGKWTSYADVNEVLDWKRLQRWLSKK